VYKYYSKKNKVKPNSKVLIVAGSDSSGGAGIQADIKTITALGSYAMTAITAITAQNTTGVKSIIAIPPKEISNQILFTAKDIKPDAIKIGMLHSAKVIESVIHSLKIIKVKKIILDPVMVAKGGTKLIDDKAIKLLKEKLIKKVTLITPNIPEAEILTNININCKEDMIFAAHKLLEIGANNVLIKGGHLRSKIVQDIFVSNSDIKIFNKISKIAKVSFKALGGKSFGRIDIKMDHLGVPHFIEANLMPGLRKGYFYRSCLLNLDMSYDDMIFNIANTGLSSH